MRHLCMMAAILGLVHVVIAASDTTTACPPGLVHVGKVTGFVVCEDIAHLNGSIAFVPTGTGAGAGANGGRTITLRKRVYLQTTGGDWGSKYGFTRHNVTTAEADILGNAMVQSEPDYHQVLAAFPPILPGWGENDRWGYAGQHTFTTSRGAGVDVVLDHNGDAGDWSGYPRPINVLGKEHATAVNTVFEGLVGSDLPIIQFVFQVSESIRWEMTVAPDPNKENNHEQKVMFRFVRIAGGEITKALFFDTYEYQPDLEVDPSDFYQTLLDQRSYWDDTFAEEQLTVMRLPGDIGQVRCLCILIFPISLPHFCLYGGSLA